VTPFPRPLLPWRQQLACFPDDLAAALGKLVIRLAPLVDAFSSTISFNHGEVAGFDGISQRGSYERLLPTEWLLRESAPWEFLRRAANAEHAFFRLAYREPAPLRSTLALLDAGPDQLGGCRIAQLAILALLAQRAEQRGESLSWQLVHHLGETPLHTLDEQSVRAFLSGRTALRSSDKALRSWQSRFPEHSIWTVSDGSLRFDGTRHVNVSIRERVTSDAPVLDLEFAARGRTPRQVSLQLPEQRTAIRLLRNPFEAKRPARAPQKAPSRRSNLMLTEQGTHVYYVDRAGDLRSIAVPNSQHAAPSRIRSYQPSPGSSVIGVTGQKKALYWLCAEGDALTLCSNKDRRERLGASCRVSFPESRGELWPLAWFSEQRMATFVAPDRSLWRADFRTGIAGPIARGVHALLSRRGTHLAAVDHWLDTDGVEGPHLLEIGHFNARSILRQSRPWGSVVLAGLGRGSNLYTLVFEDGTGTVRILARELNASTNRTMRQLSIRMPEGSSVVALHGDSNLVVLDASRTQLLVVNPSQTCTLLQTTSPITHVTGAPANAILAYVTDANELRVLGPDGGIRVRRELAP